MNKKNMSVIYYYKNLSLFTLYFLCLLSVDLSPRSQGLLLLCLHFHYRLYSYNGYTVTRLTLFLAPQPDIQLDVKQVCTL